MNMPTQSEKLDPHKIITSYHLTGPTGEAVITLTRLDTGSIEVSMKERDGVTTESTHKAYDIAIDRAAMYAYDLISNRIIG